MLKRPISYLGDSVYIGLNAENQLTLCLNNGGGYFSEIVIEDIVPQLVEFLEGFLEEKKRDPR